MSQPTQDGIKEKVLAVREVVPSRSNNEIVLVLTYYDYNVEDAIQAFLEDGAKAALQEWHFPGNKPNNKKKKKKQQQKKQAEQAAKAAAAQQGETAASSTTTPTNSNQTQATNKDIAPSTVDTKSSPSAKTEHTVQSNGPLRDLTSPTVKPAEAEGPKQVNGVEPQPPVSSNVKTSNAPKKSSEAFIEKAAGVAAASVSSTSNTSQSKRPHRLDSTSSKAGRERTLSEISVSSVASSTGGGERATMAKPHAGLEKSMKDLQRQTLSLQRLRLILGEEVDKSFKRMATVFEDLRLALNEREAELMFDMDKAKLQANEMLQKRQSRASELKTQTDRAQIMNDAQRSELRADIKHFVSERKTDEDVTKSVRFECEAEALMKQVKSFGQITAVKHNYSPRRHSVSSVSSSVISHDEPLTPLTPTTPVFLSSSSSSSSAVPLPNQSKAAQTEAAPTTAPVPREVATLTEKFISAVSLQETPPPTPSHKSASTSPQRSAPPPHAQASATDASAETEGEIVRKPRNARRRQRQKLRERELDSATSDGGSSTTPTPTIPPSTELEKKERPVSNQPKQVANRGTSPMKHSGGGGAPPQGKPAQNQDYQRVPNRRGGPGQRPYQQYNGNPSNNNTGHNRDQPRGEYQNDYQRRNNNNNHHQYQDRGQSPRKQYDRRPRSYSNKSENNGQQNGPLPATANGAVNGDVHLKETNNNHSAGSKESGAVRDHEKRPLKEVDPKSNKQDSCDDQADNNKDLVKNNHKLIEGAGGDGNTKSAVGLPQRGPRQRGSRHAQENRKSQLMMVNGDQDPNVNGHS